MSEQPLLVASLLLLLLMCAACSQSDTATQLVTLSSSAVRVSAAVQCYCSVLLVALLLP
jgi:hypothetical protein